MQVPMIDVSSNNHPTDQPIEWGQVKDAGYGAVMVKATEGLTYVNPWLEKDAEGAHAAGLHVGYYHFARPGQGAVNEQANNLWQHVKALPRDIGVALDLEVREGLSWMTLSAFGQKFLQRIPTEVAQRSLYTNPDWLDHLDGAPWGFDLWLADWGVHPRRKVWAWQSGKAEVSGITGPVDVGVYYG